MTEHLMEPLGPVGAATHCPGCGSSQTTWVNDGAQDNLLCKTCGVCWHEERGHNGQVRIETCPGCEHRPLCIAART